MNHAYLVKSDLAYPKFEYFIRGRQGYRSTLPLPTLPLSFANQTHPSLYSPPPLPSGYCTWFARAAGVPDLPPGWTWVGCWWTYWRPFSAAMQTSLVMTSRASFRPGLWDAQQLFRILLLKEKNRQIVKFNYYLNNFKQKEVRRYTRLKRKGWRISNTRQI